MIGHVIARKPTFDALWVEGEISFSTEDPLTTESPSGSWHLGKENEGYMYSYIGT